MQRKCYFKGPFGWRGGKVGESKIMGGWKSGWIENILFFLLFVWLGVEKWRNGKNEFK